jgi:hypothetical protein
MFDALIVDEGQDVKEHWLYEKLWESDEIMSIHKCETLKDIERYLAPRFNHISLIC